MAQPHGNRDLIWGSEVVVASARRHHGADRHHEAGRRASPAAKGNRSPRRREVERLREALARAQEGQTPEGIRGEIAQSWDRSLGSGLIPQELSVPYLEP